MQRAEGVDIAGTDKPRTIEMPQPLQLDFRCKVFRSENAELLFSDFAACSTFKGQEGCLK